MANRVLENSRRRLVLALGPGVRELVVRFRHRSVREQDVMLASYPRSGNTWLRFMLAHLLTGNEISFDGVRNWVPEVEHLRGKQPVLKDGGRLVKTHEAYRPCYRRAVYLVRDARDVAISYYFYQLGQGAFEGSLGSFLGRFLAGNVDGYGGWGHHVTSWLAYGARQPHCLLVSRYEDLLADPVAVMTEICHFLRIGASAHSIEGVVYANQLAMMKRKEKASVTKQSQREDVPFVREGTSGQWRQKLEDAQVDAFARVMGASLRALGYPRSEVRT